MAKGKCRSALCSAHITSIMGYTRRESTRIVAVPFVRHISLLSANQRAYVLLAVMSQCPMFGTYHFYPPATNLVYPTVSRSALCSAHITSIIPLKAEFYKGRSQCPMFGTYHFYPEPRVTGLCDNCRSALCSAHITPMTFPRV